MGIALDTNEPAVNRGIKTVAIGKKGSRDLPGELVADILDDLTQNRVPVVAKSAFFAALLTKGIRGEETRLEQAFEPGTLRSPLRLIEALSSDAPGDVKKICARLLAGETLDKATAETFGKFLLSDVPGDGARAVAACVLRMRYETPDEYEGILTAIQKTIEDPFCQIVPAGDPVVQLAEPFDGVDHSYLITPLLARHIQSCGYRAVSMIGRNSGPKMIMNLADVTMALNLPPTVGNKDLGQPKPEFGWFFHQADISRVMDRWVDIRRQMIKRPFMATLEKFVNPANARIVISSAFHPPYTEKMITVAERVGFPGAVVVRNGLEGTLAFALKRPVKIMCSARQPDGSYQRHEFEIDPEKILQIKIPLEEKLSSPQAADNARLIAQFAQDGRTGNPLFDLRVKISCIGLNMALGWLKTKGI